MGLTETKTTTARQPEAGPKPVGKAEAIDAWRGFKPGRWRREIDVRDFIVANFTPYTGGPEFLAKPTARTSAVWERLQPLLREELKKGVLDADGSTPSTLTSHGPGYIDRANEVIVGTQDEIYSRRGLINRTTLTAAEIGDQIVRILERRLAAMRAELQKLGVE